MMIGWSFASRKPARRGQGGSARVGVAGWGDGGGAVRVRAGGAGRRGAHSCRFVPRRREVPPPSCRGLGRAAPPPSCWGRAGNRQLKVKESVRGGPRSGWPRDGHSASLSQAFPLIARGRVIQNGQI